MKHQVPESLKFRKLQRRLKASRVVTAGTLELLWIATQKNAPRGDIGKFDNESIAIECDWEGDPDELIDSLVETGWMDRCPVHRLLVHDWQHHAPRYVHGIVAKVGGFAERHPLQSSTTVPDYSPPQSITTVADYTRQQPNLTKPNLTKPEREGRAAPLARPSLEEVRKYREERKSSVDAEKFFDHYEANGWVQSSGRPIGDWQAAFRTWEKRESDFPSKSKPEYKPPGQRKKDPQHEYEMQRSKLVKLAREEAWDDERLRAAIEKIKPKQAQGSSP